MTAKDAIQIIRDNARVVQETGVSSIPIEALKQLLNHPDSGEVDKDIALLIAAEKDRATAKYGARVNAQLELFKSVIGSGQAALKSFFLLNGGAAVAVLALIGHLSTSATTAGQVNKYALPLVSLPVVWFLLLWQRAVRISCKKHTLRNESDGPINLIRWSCGCASVR